MEEKFQKHELTPDTFEKAMSTLQKVEAEYQNHTRPFSHVLYVANKIQEMFFQGLQSAGKIDASLDYETTAKLSLTDDGETVWSQLLITGNFSLIQREAETMSISVPSESNFMEEIISEFTQLLARYRQTTGHSRDLALQATELIKKENVMPSEIFAFSKKLVGASYNA